MVEWEISKRKREDYLPIWERYDETILNKKLTEIDCDICDKTFSQQDEQERNYQVFSDWAIDAGPNESAGKVMKALIHRDCWEKEIEKKWKKNNKKNGG